MGRDNLTFVEEQAKWSRLKELSGVRKLPVMEVFFGWKVKDKNGNILRENRGYSHSPTRNYYNFYGGTLLEIIHEGGYSDGYTSAKNTSATLKTTHPYISVNTENGGGYDSPITDDSRGIVIGTGSTAESIDDYVWETLIVDGTGGGQMLYSAMAFSRSWDGGLGKFTRRIYREFTNGSGGSITVNEATAIENITGWANQWYCMSRDIISPGQAVADSESFLVYYDFELTYP